MINTIEVFEKLKTALLEAMNNGEYSVEPEMEGQFLLLLDKSLRTTELAPYINDINFIINGYMSLADEISF